MVPPELFDEDVYDYFCGAALERDSDAQAALIAELGGLRRGTAVLDVPCGDGRIAVRLAQRGCRVVGVDRSARFIARARARPGGERVRFDVGDMRALRHDAEFDCVVNWFTSFGYFDASANRALLRAFRRALRPRGRLVLDLRNPALLRRAAAAGGGTAVSVVDRDLDLLVDRARLDGDRTQVERFIVRDGRVRKIEFSLESFDSEALAAALREAGFGTVELFDGAGEPFTAQSARLVAVAHAPPS